VAFGSEVWTVSADGKLRQRLFQFGCCVETWALPVWSPDGKEIAFSANDEETGGTFVVNADGSGSRIGSQAHTAGGAFTETMGCSDVAAPLHLDRQRARCAVSRLGEVSAIVRAQ
jgi:hypothetical protein